MIQTFNPLRKSRTLGLLFALILTALSGAFTLNAQLTISKEATPLAHPGDTVSYRITYKNAGTVIQTNVVIEDILPNIQGGLIKTFPAGIYNSTTRKVTWNIGTVNAGTGVVYVYGAVGIPGSVLNAEVGSEKYYPQGLYLRTYPDVMSNTASIRSDQTTTPVTSTPVNTTLTQSCTTTLSQASGVVKSSTSSAIKYIVAITNTGDIWNKWTMSAAWVPIPNDSELIPSFENMTGSPLNNNQTDWIAPGATTTVMLKLVSPAGTNPSIGTPKEPNTTRVTATPVACGDPVSKDFVTEICGGNCPDYMYVSAYKLDIPDPVQSGTDLIYRVAIFNSLSDNKNAPLPVSNITLKEILPAGVTQVGGITPPTNNGTPVPYTTTGTNQWNFASLPGGLTTFDITVHVNPNTPNNTLLSNTIQLTTPTAGAAPFNTWTEVTRVLSAHNLYIHKTATPSNVKKGDIVTYTLNYGNTGNYQGDAVTITDNYDEQYMTPVLPIPNGGVIDDGAIKWNITPNPFPIGQTGTITYQMQVISQNFPVGLTTIKNTAYIDNHQYPVISHDPDLTNNQSDFEVFVTNLPDLKIEKTANLTHVSAAASPGTTLTYTLAVSNIGDENLTGGYTVTDQLPASVTYVSSSPAGVYDLGNHTVTWTLATPVQNDGIPINYQINVGGITYDKGGSNLINVATVSSPKTEKTLLNNTATLVTPVYPNFWLGNVSSEWNNPVNWTYGVPGTNGIDDDVIFATASNYTSAAERDLILDQDRQIGKLINQTPDQTLIIPHSKTLTVNETATTNAPERLKLESEPGQANGALIFNLPAQNQHVQAPVEFASKSKPGTGTWPRVWQYFGTPVNGRRLNELFTNVQGSIYGGNPAINSIVRIYDETLNDPKSYQEKWHDIALTEYVSPFLGYEITQPQSTFDNAATSPYTFKGELITDDNYNLIMNISPAGIYSRGNYILANPYAAPIFISKMLPTDFDNMAQTIYIYNTGSRQDWKTNNGAGQTGDLPGTYSAIPILTANTIGKTMIPSMQAFMVKAITDSPPTASFKFRYATVNRGSLTFPNEPMRAKRTEASEYEDIKPLLTMDVIGQNSSDRVYLITADGTTKGYDPGWDGSKALSTDMVQLYALDIDNRRLQVSSDNDLNETYIGFRSGGESTYSLNFKFNSEMVGQYDALYIQDLATGITQEFTDGTTLSFTSAASTAEKRFKILAPRIITGVNNTTHNNETILVTANLSTIRVDNNTNGEVMLKVYNLTGQTMLIEKAAVGVQYINHNLTKGTYLIEAKSVHSGSRTTVKAIIH